MGKFRHLTVGLLTAGALMTSISPADAETCGTTTSNLIAGQHYTAGQITIANDETYIYVNYATSSPWLMSEAHAAAATTLAGIPQSKSGNPIPGRFPYSATFDPEVTDYTFSIPLAGLVPETGQVFVAAHAVVQAPKSQGGSQTAWGEGADFPGANWATYIVYTPQVCGGGGGE